MTPFPEFKTITVSGLHPKVGKTLLACQIISLLRNAGAIKITMYEGETAVIYDEDLIMTEGTDTFRLKSSGAEKVVWIKTDESSLKQAFFQATTLLKGYKNLVIEGNSVLKYFDPETAVFISDETVTDNSKIKHSRTEALLKADLIVFNQFSENRGLIKAAEKKCMDMNQKADFIRLKLTQKEKTEKFIKSYLQKKGFLINP